MTYVLQMIEQELKNKSSNNWVYAYFNISFECSTQNNEY